MLSQAASAQALEKSVIAGFNSKLVQRVTNFSSATGVSLHLRSCDHTSMLSDPGDSLRRGSGTPTPLSRPFWTLRRSTDSSMPPPTETQVTSGGESTTSDSPTYTDYHTRTFLHIYSNNYHPSAAAQTIWGQGVSNLLNGTVW